MKIIKKFEKTIVFLLKVCLYIWLIASFFLIMGIENWPLLRPSRTAAVTIVTFVVVGLGMTAAYGTYDIGKRKSKPIISSIALATVITDIVTDIQLSIMNTNPENNTTFTVANIGFLILVFAVQMIGIIIFAYGGNAIYFKMNQPEKCCVVTSSKKSFMQVASAVECFKKQFAITCIRDYREDDVHEAILKCDTVFLYDIPIKERTELVEFCYRNLINIYYNPEIADIVEINSKYVIYDDISLISSPVKDMSFEQRVLKRLMDLILSVLAMILASPILIGCAIAIKACDGGKVIFKQQRATKHGRIFYVYKFRTMKEDVENYSAEENDDRVTSVGKFLRKSRFDELPQLFNILKGEMSLVGPRPEMLENIYMYTEEYPEFEYRLRAKAGLTGYAQIAGKYNTSPRYKLILDLMYIENYSVIKDLKLVLQTLVVFFKPDSTEGFQKKLDENVAKYSKAAGEKWE